MAEDHPHTFGGVREPEGGVSFRDGHAGYRAGGFENAVPESGVAEMPEADFGDMDRADETAELGARGPDTATLDPVDGHGFADEMKFAMLGEKNKKRPIAHGQGIDPQRQARNEAVAEDNRWGVDVIESCDAGKSADQRVGGVRDDGGSIADLVANFHLVETERATGMFREMADLCREFVRVGPIVIALQQGDVLATRGGIESREIGVATAIGLRMKGTDAVGKTGGEIFKNPASLVCRSIVADKDFHGKVRNLGERAFDGPGQEPLMVEGRDEDTDKWQGSGGPGDGKRAHVFTGSAGTPKTV